MLGEWECGLCERFLRVRDGEGDLGYVCLESFCFSVIGFG